MKFKKLSVLFCSLLALTSVMAVSAAEGVPGNRRPDRALPLLAVRRSVLPVPPESRYRARYTPPPAFYNGSVPAPQCEITSLQV